MNTCELLSCTQDLWCYLKTMHLKDVCAVIKAAGCLFDTLFTYLHWPRKKRFRWFTEARIPRALVLDMLWRRVKTEITPSTLLAGKVRYLNNYFYEVSTSGLNTEHWSTTAKKHFFTPSTGIKFPTARLSVARFCCRGLSRFWSTIMPPDQKLAHTDSTQSFTSTDYPNFFSWCQTSRHLPV